MNKGLTTFIAELRHVKIIDDIRTGPVRVASRIPDTPDLIIGLCEVFMCSSKWEVHKSDKLDSTWKLGKHCACCAAHALHYTGHWSHTAYMHYRGGSWEQSMMKETTWPGLERVPCIFGLTSKGTLCYVVRHANSLPLAIYFFSTHLFSLWYNTSTAEVQY